jgi:starch phosphorylase
MAVQENRGKGQYLYTCKIKCCASGRYGFTVRVTPQGDEMIKSVPGLITWTEQVN